MGGGRKAMADDAHGVNVHKNCEASRFGKKRGGKESDVELQQVSAYDSNDRSVTANIGCM